jgi:choline monooxygenase
MAREATLRDFVTDEDIAAIWRPVERASGLPGRAYGAEFYALERRQLFPRSWCAVAFANDVPEPGDAFPVDLAGWPLLLVRGADRRIRAFLNICRHRAMRIVSERQSGRASLSCPWHGWTYGLDGKLELTPRVGGEKSHDDPRLCRDDSDLKPVPVAQWLDLVFVNIAGNAPPFADHIRPLTALLGDYDLSDLHPAEEWTLDYPANWKLASEGAIEDYHLPWGHPQLVRGLKTHYPRSDAERGCFMSVSSAYHDALIGDRTPDGDPTWEGPHILRRGADGLKRSFFMMLFPTGSIWTRPNQIVQGMWLPQGHEVTRLRYTHYYPAAIAKNPRFDEARRGVAAQFRDVLAQDIPFLQRVHDNMQLIDEAGLRPRFSPFWETNLPEFQRSVIELLDSAPAGA